MPITPPTLPTPPAIPDIPQRSDNEPLPVKQPGKPNPK